MNNLLQTLTTANCTLTMSDVACEKFVVFIFNFIAVNVFHTGLSEITLPECVSTCLPVFKCDATVTPREIKVINATDVLRRSLII